MNDNLTNILAIELLCSARGIEFRAPLKTSAPLQATINTLRKEVSSLEEDRYMARDIEKASSLIANGHLLTAGTNVPLPILQEFIH